MSSLKSPLAVLSSSETFVFVAISYVALSLQVCEWIRSLPFEIEYIWRRSPTSIIKWQYILSRYGGILIQVLILIFDARLSSKTGMSAALCNSWMAFRWIAIKTLILSVNISLVLRIFAFYARNLQVAIPLSLLVICEYIHGIIWGFFIARTAKMSNSCFMMQSPKASIYSVAFHFIVEIIILALTAYKFSENSHASCSYRVTRDTCYASVAMLFVYSLSLLNFLLSRCHCMRQATLMTLNQSVVVIMPGVATAANCHIINNMERLSATFTSRMRQSTAPVLFTSIELEDMDME